MESAEPIRETATKKLRLTFTITQEQLYWLKQEAATRQLKVSALIRQALDALRQQGSN